MSLPFFYFLPHPISNLNCIQYSPISQVCMLLHTLLSFLNVPSLSPWHVLGLNSNITSSVKPSLVCPRQSDVLLLSSKSFYTYLFMATWTQLSILHVNICLLHYMLTSGSLDTDFVHLYIPKASHILLTLKTVNRHLWIKAREKILVKPTWIISIFTENK